MPRPRRRGHLGTVREHVAHLLHGADVEEVRAVRRHQVGVAPVDRALYLGLRDLPRPRLEGIAHLERAAGRVRHVHHRHDARQLVERGQEPVGIRDLPAHPSHARLPAAEEVQNVARLGDEPAVGVGRLEAEFRKNLERRLLSLHVAHVVAEHVVGVRTADRVRSGRRAAADLLVAVTREELGGDGRPRAGELHVDHGNVRHEAEEILARRHLHLDLLAQDGQVVADEGRHRRARNHLVVSVDALERPLQHVRERHEPWRALALLRERRRPHEARGPVHEEAVRRGDVLERQLRPREQLELPVLLEILRLEHAPHARGLRAHGDDVEEIARREADLGCRRSLADVLQHAEEIVVALREPHALPEGRFLRRMAHARLVHEHELRLHAAPVELAHEVAPPCEQHAHPRTRRASLNIRSRVHLRHAPRRAQLGLMPLLRLGVVHPVHQDESKGNDVRTHHRELPVRLAGTVGEDVPVVEQRETRALLHTVGKQDHARRLVRGRVPLRLHHRTAVPETQSMGEHLFAAPADEQLMREVLRTHASTSTKRAAFASTTASNAADSIPRSSASLHRISPGEGRAPARP